jgi:hemerythrin-like domain-containing protein
MKPTDILTDEHRVIQQVLNCLEKMIQESQAAGKLDKGAATDAVAFFRNFADRCHHGKEEAHLFPAMEAKGFSPQCGPTAVMRLEHEQGRSHVRGMDEAIQRASEGDRAALDDFARHAQGYLELLREHINKEDHCLFAMANQAFSDEDQNALLKLFEHVEAEEMGLGTHQRYLAIANSLAQRYHVPLAASGPACGCGH